MKINLKYIRSILVFILLLEIFFWAGGWCTQVSQFVSNAALSKKKGVYRIMCIGESLTLVGEKDSYPAQLESMLNTAAGRDQFQVINQGVGGATTSRIARDLPQWLDTYKPDMVVAMIGVIDPINESDKKITENHEPSIIEKTKLSQLLKQLSKKAEDSLEQFLERQKKQFNLVSKEKESVLDEYEQFKVLLKKQSEEQKKLYMLAILADGQERYDIAQLAYEKFLEMNKDQLIEHWMTKKYGVFLNKIGNYEKFVQWMNRIDYRSWMYNWVKGYCHSEPHMQKVKDTIEDMVEKRGVSALAYGWIGSCYEEGNRKDLADIYLSKMESATSSYYYPATRNNYLTIKDMIVSRQAQPVFVQYPMRNLRPLMSIFEKDPDKDKIIFVDNGESFQQGVREKSYEHFFIDRMSGDAGHATHEGNYLLASNVASVILKKLGVQ